MTDYSQWGFDNRLRKVTSLKTNIVTSTDFETKYEVSGDRINISRANLGSFVKKATGGSALGTFNLTQALNLTSSISYDKPQIGVRTFGKSVVGIYQGAGTNSGSQIYPIRGTGVTLGRYEVVGGQMDYSNYNGTADQWRAMLIDTNGTSSQVITFIADWVYLDYRSGVVS